MSGRATEGNILVAGSSNTDLVCQTDRLPHPGETVASRGFAVFPGGKAANQAVAAARAGSKVVFAGCFGDDDYGRDRRTELESEGIDLNYCLTLAGEPSGLALIAVDPAGENLIVTVGGANERIGVEQVQRAVRDRNYDVVLMPNEAPPDVILEATHAADPALVILNAAPYAANIGEVAGSVDLLVCNQVEASLLLGDNVGNANANLAVEMLAERAKRGAVLTLGGDGAVGFMDGVLTAIPALEVDVVDTTGAGDAFCGALASWLAAGSPFGAALRAGAVAGALATTRAGAQPSLPVRSEIAALL